MISITHLGIFASLLAGSKGQELGLHLTEMLNARPHVCRSPAAPQTPSPVTPATTVPTSHGQVQDPALNSASNSNASYGTSSSGAYSGDSNVGRPQPVEELHSLVMGEADPSCQQGALHPSQANLCSSLHSIECIRRLKISSWIPALQLKAAILIQ